ncbi:uncharacterized protein LOC131315272 [Rhododendron vialii]|uniref:uncharacterized protein LOC131315272 n=1 Tax=Rhododendron vialii TaxID=182163 RepID=UPI00265D8230|nr:uncharacterized protein LOC131315272 [Rhododendron vialii]
MTILPLPHFHLLGLPLYAIFISAALTLPLSRSRPPSPPLQKSLRAGKNSYFQPHLCCPPSPLSRSNNGPGSTRRRKIRFQIRRLCICRAGPCIPRKSGSCAKNPGKWYYDCPRDPPCQE